MNRLLSCQILIAVFIAFGSPATASEAVIVLTDVVQLKLGDAFTAEGEYYRAITEYKKLLILFPNSSLADTAHFNIGTAYYHGEEYEPAVRAFELLRKRFPYSKHSAAAAYQQGLALIRLNRPDQAADAFKAAEAAPPASPDLRKAVFGGVLAEYDRGNDSASRRKLELFIMQHPDDPGSQQATTALKTLDQHQNMPSISPLAAGMLSAILPGSGHIYAGHYGDGITSLLLNGLFIGGAVIAIKQENYAMAGVAGLIGLPFYLGNIYGASNAANKWNIAVRKDLRGKLSVALEYPFW